MKNFKRILSMLLVISMLCGMIVMPVSAEEITYSCGVETIHEHDTECYTSTQVCSNEEHSHNDACYVNCTKEFDCENAEEGHVCSAETCTMHTHVAECCPIAEYAHGENCYESKLTCELHVHTDECMVKEDESSDDNSDEGTPESSEEESSEAPSESSEVPSDGNSEDEILVVDDEIPGESSTPEDTTVVWDEENKILYLNGAELTEGLTLDGGWTVIASGYNTIAAGEADAITATGGLTIKGGELYLSGANGIMADSVVMEDITVGFDATVCGIQVYNETGAATVTLKNVDGEIVGDYAGIYVNGECAETEASVTVEDCELDVTSEATGYNGRARKSGITVYVAVAKKVESSITIKDSVVNAIGADAGLSINNYLGDADATNYASSHINISNSTVYAEGTNGTWAAIFASVLGQHADADSIITVTDSSVYAVSPNTGILTSSQAGESKIILDNSILGAAGKTALSMIEETSQTQAAELKNGSTYVQMTPAAVMKGEIVNFNGKTIIATAGDGITFDRENDYYVIPQGSAVTETFTDGTVKEYTFNNQAGGIGGFDYAKEEIWGYDVPDPVKEIIITTPEELIDFATRTQPGGDLGNCEGWTVKLGADIDMDGYDWYYRNAEGTIVTDHRIPDFDGSFDGQGYTISNMSYVDEYAAATEEVPLGMFIELDGTLENLTLDTVTVDSVAMTRFGALVNDYSYQLEGSYVKNCDVKNVTITQTAGRLVFGGMFWKILGSAEITDCHVDGLYVDTEASLSGSNTGRCGGFVATGAEGGTLLKDCSVTDFEIETSKVINYVGGFVGGTSGCTYDNCDVTNFTVTVENKAKTHRTVAGFAGYTEGNGWNCPLVIKNCDVTGLDLDLGAASTSTDKKGDAGFIGLFNNTTAGITIENCSAEGTINVEGDILVGGFLAQPYNAPKNVEIKDCTTSVNVTSNVQAGGFVGEYAPVSGNAVTYTNCTASGDVTGNESVGSFLDADTANADGIIGGTYNYDPENVDSATGEVNNVAPGYRALDNGDGTWTVFPDNGKEVVKVAFHRWNDAAEAYENWRTVEVFKDVDFFEADYNNALNYSHPTYRFADGIGELDAEADDATEREFSYWTDAPDGTELVLDNEIEVLADMNVYAAYKVPFVAVCRIVETGVEYATLAEAVADANASEGADTIEMLTSIDFDAEKALSITGDVTIIGEHTISRGAYTGTLFTVPAGSSLTFDGGIVFDGSNNWIFDKELYENDLYNREDNAISAYAYSAEGGTVGAAAAIVVNGTVTAKDATFQNFFNTKDNNGGDGAIFKVNANATLTTDGALIDHVATYGANAVAHLASNSEWYIKGDTMISNNFGGRNGGICRNDSGRIYMSGGTIKDTAGKNVNGTVFMMYGKGSQFIMTGGTICGNSSVFGVNNGRCAAVYLHSQSYMKMTGGTICHNVGGSRGGIDSYSSSSVLDINRVDQTFVDGVYANENGKDAYTASNHPMIVDNVSLIGHTTHDVGHSYNFDTWWVTGGIYTQDVDEFCAEGYICIPYEDSERTDDYIVVPGYRVKYYSVETVETTDETTGETTSEIQTTLVKKYFHMLPRDKFWYEMDERANYFEITLEEGGTISTWYTEKELTNVYDFANAKLESDLDLYGEVNALTVAYDYNGGMDGDKTRSTVSTYEESYNPAKVGMPKPTNGEATLVGWKYAVDVNPESESMEVTDKWYMGETLTTSTRLIAQWETITVEVPEDEPPVPINLGTKTDELLDRDTNRYQVTIDVPGADGITGHDEIILMVDGSYSLDQEWPAMKEAINTIGRTVLNGSGTTQLTLMAFGMGDNEVLVHVKDADELAAALGELPGNLLYGRSSTNCEAGFDGVANYIKNHDNTLNDVHVVYISDGNINTHEIPRAFAQNWKTWATKFGALTVAQAAFEGAVAYGENLPSAFTTVFGNRFDGVAKEEILNRAFAGEVTNEEFLAFADQIWEDVYAYSGLHIGVEYPVSVAERAFVKYDKENGTYIQDVFYYTTYRSSYVTYSGGSARTIAAAEELAAMDEVAAMYVVDYDEATAWMNTGITSEKATFVHSANGIAGLVKALEGALGEMAKAPINNPVITDYMSKWVNLDATTLKIIDNTTNEVLWTAANGWAEGVTPTTAKNPPVVVELVDPADYAAGGDDVVGNTSGDIYKLTWYLKDDAMLRSDDFRLYYEVTVDTEEKGFVYETEYPANGDTSIKYTDDEGVEKGNDIDVPDVNAVAPKLTVAYHYDGGVYEEAGKSHVTTEAESYNPVKENAMPEPVKEGYTLTGWKIAVVVDPESDDLQDTGKWYMGETFYEDARLIAQWVKTPDEQIEKEDPIPVELGTKWDEILNRGENRYTVNIDVPGANGITGHDEIILMVDGSYSMDNEWPAMKEAINTIGRTVLNGSGTTQLTLMAFGMGDNEVLVHVKDADELAAALGELPGNLLYGRSSTNCEAGFDGVANYIKNHDNTLNDVQVVFISDGKVNTDETPRAFAQNWKTWTKFGALAVAQETFGGAVSNGENVPAAFTAMFGDRFAGATDEEIIARAFAGEVTDEEFLAFADQVWADVYAYSGLYIGVKYPVSVAERAFVKYDKEHGTYIQDLFYYTTYKSGYVTYGDCWSRTPVAANELAAMEEVSAMYVVDYDSYTAWMDTGITSEKSTFIQSNGIAGLVKALEGALGEMAKAPINDPVITDYMSKWVNLDATTLKIIDNTTKEVLWTVADGWLTEKVPTAKQPPVVVELVDPADYAAGGNDVVGNTSGDIYKLTWYLKDGAMLRSDDFRLSYEVTVDTKEEGFVFKTDYPANGNTFIKYTDDEGEEKGNDIDVPDVDAVCTELKVKKVNEQKQALTGAKFELFAVNGESKISLGEYAVDAKGEMTIGELVPGNYELLETEAPDGYLTADEAVKFTVTNSLDITVTETEFATYEDGVLIIVNGPPHAAVVLTIDMSGTMYRYKMGGTRYVDVAKAKALDFVNQYAASTQHNGKRMLAVAAFDTDAKVVLNWVDVSTASGLAAAKTAINGMKVVDNGKTSSNYVCTNFDGGIILTRNLLKQNTVSEVDKKFAIILSDGAPTVTVNNDTDYVGTIESSFWGNQLDMNGKKYQNARCGGGWTHPAEVDRTLKYLLTGDNNLADQTSRYGNKEGIFFVGVGGDMTVKLFNDAVYGTSNGTRSSDVKRKPAAFNHVEALQGYTQDQILKLTTGDWLTNLANRVGGTYVSATNATALANEFNAILESIVNS